MIRVGLTASVPAGENGSSVHKRRLQNRICLHDLLFTGRQHRITILQILPITILLHKNDLIPVQFSKNTEYVNKPYFSGKVKSRIHFFPERKIKIILRKIIQFRQTGCVSPENSRKRVTPRHFIRRRKTGNQLLITLFRTGEEKLNKSGPVHNQGFSHRGATDCEHGSFSYFKLEFRGLSTVWTDILIRKK